MSKPHTISRLILQPRQATGTTWSRKARRIGLVPGVVYGHGQATPIAVETKDLVDLLLSGNRSHVVDAQIGDTVDSVLLRRIETDPLTRRPLSVDFQRVGRDETVSAVVPVVTTGSAVGVRDQGGVLDVVTHALEIKGPAQGIPDNLTVDVASLAVHQHVVASQVELPAGFALVTPPDTIVVTVELMRAAAGAEPGAEETEPTEAPTTPPTE